MLNGALICLYAFKTQQRRSVVATKTSGDQYPSLAVSLLALGSSLKLARAHIFLRASMEGFNW
jgi:hypothetical protein